MKTAPYTTMHGSMNFADAGLAHSAWPDPVDRRRRSRSLTFWSIIALLKAQSAGPDYKRPWLSDDDKFDQAWEYL